LPAVLWNKNESFKTGLNLCLKLFITATYVDMFGGSGLLSHTVSLFIKGEESFYNDFDNYRERLDNIKAMS
jgi:hypothetical protein